MYIQAFNGLVIILWFIYDRACVGRKTVQMKSIPIRVLVSGEWVGGCTLNSTTGADYNTAKVPAFLMQGARSPLQQPSCLICMGGQPMMNRPLSAMRQGRRFAYKCTS